MNRLQKTLTEFVKDFKNYTATFFMMMAAFLMALAPILGTKVANLGSLKFAVGLIPIIFVYGIINIINELWGKRLAQMTSIFLFVLILTIYLIFFPLAIILPTSFSPVGFAGIITASLRSLLAVETALVVSTLIVDITIFSKLKEKHIGLFFFRASVSNIVASLIAAFIFVYGTFWGTRLDLFSLAMTQFMTRIILVILVNILSSLVVRILKKNDIGSKA